MEGSLRRLLDVMPLDLPTLEGYPPAITDSCDLRFGFRRGWHQCQESVNDRLEALEIAYAAWQDDPTAISYLIDQVHHLLNPDELADAA